MTQESTNTFLVHIIRHNSVYFCLVLSLLVWRRQCRMSREEDVEKFPLLVCLFPFSSPFRLHPHFLPPFLFAFLSTSLSYSLLLPYISLTQIKCIASIVKWQTLRKKRRSNCLLMPPRKLWQCQW